MCLYWGCMWGQCLVSACVQRPKSVGQARVCAHTCTGNRGLNLNRGLLGGILEA